MKKVLETALLAIIITVAGCGDVPSRPVTCKGTPRNFKEVVVEYKGNPYIVGYRFETDGNTITSVYDPYFLGMNAAPFDGPDKVREKILLLRESLEKAEKNGKEIMFFGDKIGSFNGKDIIALWMYIFEGKEHQIFGNYDWGTKNIPPN